MTILATGIYAMGDARFYCRNKFADAATNVQIIDYFSTMKIPSECKLIAVQKSIMYDGTNIPDGDADKEWRYKILCKHTEDRTVLHEIPCVDTPSFDLVAWFAANGSKILDYEGVSAVEIVDVKITGERKAKGR